MSNFDTFPFSFSNIIGCYSFWIFFFFQFSFMLHSKFLIIETPRQPFASFFNQILNLIDKKTKRSTLKDNTFSMNNVIDNWWSFLQPYRIYYMSYSLSS
jgi:hypothetical protein